MIRKSNIFFFNYLYVFFMGLVYIRFSILFILFLLDTVQVRKEAGINLQQIKRFWVFAGFCLGFFGGLFLSNMDGIEVLF